MCRCIVGFFYNEWFWAMFFVVDFLSVLANAVYIIYYVCTSLLSFQLIHFWAILMVRKEIYVPPTVHQLLFL